MHDTTIRYDRIRNDEKCLACATRDLSRRESVSVVGWSWDCVLFSDPDFVSSYDIDDYVYFFFRETAIEYINCGKVRRRRRPGVYIPRSVDRSVHRAVLLHVYTFSAFAVGRAQWYSRQLCLRFTFLYQYRANYLNLTRILCIGYNMVYNWLCECNEP